MRRGGWCFARASSIALIASMALLTACGGGGGSSAGGGPVPPPIPPVPIGNGSTTPTIVNFGDAPSDRVISFELTMNSVTLSRADNSTVTLLSTPRRVEVTHVSGSAEPLAIPSIPQGTYTSATLAVSAPDVIYIDNSARPVEKQDTTFTKTINITFNPALTVGATPLVLVIDVDARNSISIDPASGNVTFSPVASIHQSVIGNDDTHQEVENGEFEHIIGQVTAASASSFTITTGDSDISMMFATNSATSFEGVSGAASLPLNTIVRVEGGTQQDGTLLASEVEVLSSNGAEAEGIVTTATGNPATKATVVVQCSSGSGLTASSLGSTVTVDIGNSTKFKVDDGKIDLGGLSLPTFSMATLSRGQRIEAESDNGIVNGELAAETVKLQQQALLGAISAISDSQFTLTLPNDSAFALLTGKTTLRVSTQRNTLLLNNVSVTQGTILKVRGLVFFDPVQGGFVMVAGRITPP